MSQYDVAVIGGGPAGLSAALVLARARRTVVVVDAGKLRNAPARHMYGYLSRDGVVPAELVAAGRQEVTGYGGDIVPGTASDLVPDGRSGFWVLLADGNRISARRLLVTTGLRDELPDIPGLRDRWARDVLHCPYCHGHEVRDRPLGVIGGTAGAVRLCTDRPPVDPGPCLFHPTRHPHRRRTEDDVRIAVHDCNAARLPALSDHLPPEGESVREGRRHCPRPR
jgi:thioredoxin reductase